MKKHLSALIALGGLVQGIDDQIRHLPKRERKEIMPPSNTKTKNIVSELRRRQSEKEARRQKAYNKMKGEI